MRDSCDPGGGVGWLAAGGIINSLYQVPSFVLCARASCLHHASVIYLHGFPAHFCIFLIFSGICVGKRKRWRDRFNLALANQQSLFYFASYFASVLNPSC